jgi:uroporphyrinogen-III decarboxylase
MTSRERMRVAIAGGKPDRIPVAMVADYDFYCKAAGRPMWEYRYGDDAARAAIHREALARFPANDFIHCWGAMPHDFTSIWGGVPKTAASTRRVVMVEGQPFVERTDTGERTPIPPRATASHWPGGAGEPTTSQSSYPGCITREADIARVLGPVPTLEELLALDLFGLPGIVRRELGDRAYISAGICATVPEAIDALGGFESGMLAMHESPALVRAVAEAAAIRKSVQVEAAATRGVDAVWIVACLEGADMISPKVWREVALPGHRLLVETARKHGLQTLFWFLGDCLPLLEDFVGLGIDALVVEQGRRGYSSDPVEIRRRVGRELCVYGWNWELDFIEDRRDNITREVERQIHGAGTEGAFVMGTTYMTSEASLGAVEHYAREVVRVSREVGYG